ncbi:MAG: hypothetical protein ACRYFZ_26910 [Janthinobacterium lividum]
MKHLLLALALLLAIPALAQTTAPTTYEFLTVVESQSQQGSFAKILFAPAFQGKTELPLQELPGTAAGGKYIATYRQNIETVNQQLETVTSAGWELVHTSSIDRGHTYLFRRRKS